MNNKAISEVFDKFEQHVHWGSDMADLEYLLLRMDRLLELLEQRLATVEYHAERNCRTNGNVFRR